MSKIPPAEWQEPRAFAPDEVRAEEDADELEQAARSVQPGARSSAFTDREIDYLRSQTLARLATADAEGQPHVIPVTFWFNEDEDAIDVGGIDFAAGKKWRDATQNPKVAFLLDDVPEPRKARAIEVRGTAELHETGGGSINPRIPNFVPQFMRIRPERIVSWGLEAEGYTPYARTV
jgi:pyridoxamine 5'-phosphate oxidase family protein